MLTLNELWLQGVGVAEGCCVKKWQVSESCSYVYLDAGLSPDQGAKWIIAGKSHW
jgi:hypothetical protein